jgi:hypothetical protein
MMPLQGRLSVERMCQLAGVSRAGFYRQLVEIAPHEEEMELRESSSGFTSNIGGTMGIAVSPPNCAIAACWSIGSAWLG